MHKAHSAHRNTFCALLLLVYLSPAMAGAEPVDMYYQNYKDVGNPWEGEWRDHSPSDTDKGYLRIDHCLAKSCEFKMISNHSGSLNMHAGMTLDSADTASFRIKTDPACQIHFKKLSSIHAIEVQWSYACPSQGFSDSNVAGKEIFEWENSISEITRHTQHSQ